MDPDVFFGRTGTVTINTSPPPEEFSETLRAFHSSYDQNGDGYVSQEEINTCIGKKKYTGKSAAVLAVLKDTLSDSDEVAYDEFGDENDGITLADVKAYERRLNTLKKHPKRDDALVDGIQKLYKSSLKKIAQANRLKKSIVSGSGGASDIDGLSVRQAGVGSCYFLAATVSLAMQRPDQILDIIQTLPSSLSQPTQYKVRFPGLSSVIKITQPTETEIALLSIAHKNGLWLSILEKALGVYINNHEGPLFDGKLFPHDTIIDAADDDPFYEPLYTFQGDLREGLRFFVSEVNVDNLSLTRKKITKTRLEDALLRRKLQRQANKLVIAGINKWSEDAKEFRPPLRDGHAYAVYQFDDIQDHVYVYDPHGTDCGMRGRGRYKLSLDDFCRIFNTVAYEV